MLQSRLGPQATETMGSGTEKGRMTPFLTCPRSTRAPDRMISPSRRTRSKTRASAQFRELLALLGGPPPLSLVPWSRGLQVPGSRSPPPPGAVPAPAAGNSSAWLAPRPRIPVARGPQIPSSAAYPGLRNARRTAPSPTAETGCDRPRVAPCPVGFVPRALRAGGSGTSWSKAREGTWAGPLPLPRNGRGKGHRPLLEAPAPRFPSAERKLPPPPTGLTWGRGRGFALGPPLLAPLPPSRLGPDSAPQTKFEDPNPAQGKRLSLSWVERAEGTPPVPASGRRPFGSPTGHCLAETYPFGSSESAHATTPCPSLHPSVSQGLLRPEPPVPPAPQNLLVWQPNPGC